VGECELKLVISFIKDRFITRQLLREQPFAKISSIQLKPVLNSHSLKKPSISQALKTGDGFYLSSLVMQKAPTGAFLVVVVHRFD